MKVQYMEEFIALVELRNFTKAAEKVFISQSTFSKHIAEIEKELGSQLVIRTKHSVQPTELGLKVYQSFKDITSRYSNLLHEIELDKQGLTGILRVGVLYYSLNTLLYPLFEQFREEYPGVDLKIVSLQPPQIMECFEQGKIDLGLTLHYDGISRYPAQYKAREFYADRLIAAVHDSDPLAEKETVSLQDLNGKTVLLMDDEPDYNQYVRRLLAEEKVTPECFHSSLQIDTTFSDIRRKDAVMLLPKQMQQLHRDNIRFLSVEEQDPAMKMVYIEPSGTAGPIPALFTEMIRKIYS